MTIFDDALRTIFDTINDAGGNMITFRGTQVKGDFRHGWVVIRDVETRAPHFECIEADVSGVIVRNRTTGATADDTLIVNGVNYAIIEIQPDGEGSVTLILSRD